MSEMPVSLLLSLLPFLLSGLAGIGLGVIFFGGLWWTLRRGLASPRPLLWLGTSLLLRSGIVLFGFYAVGHGQWQRMMACLLGFILVRLIALRLARPHAPVLVFGVAQTTVEVHHAP